MLHLPLFLPEPLRSSQDNSLTTTPSGCHILWTWMLLHPTKLPERGVGFGLLGTRAPLNPDLREVLVLPASDSPTSPYECLCLLSLWEPSSERKDSPSRMSPNRLSPSKLLIYYYFIFTLWNYDVPGFCSNNVYPG